MASANTYATIEKFQQQQGWTDNTILSLLIDFIDNQDSPEALRDFLAATAENENTQAETHLAVGHMVFPIVR